MKRILIGLVVALLVAVVGGFLYLKSWLTPERLRAEVVKAVEPHYKGKVSLGDVRLGFSLPLAVLVEDLKVSNPDASTHYLTMEALALSLELKPLFSGKVQFSSISLMAPTILLIHDAQGQLEVLQYLAAKEAAGGGSTGSPPAPEAPKPGGVPDPAGGTLDKLHLDDVTIQDARIEVRKPGADPVVIAPLNVSLALAGRALTIREAALTALGTIEVTAVGAVDLAASGPALKDLRVQAEGPVPPGVLDPAVHGKVDTGWAADLTLNGPLAKLVGAGKVEATPVTWTPPDPRVPPLVTGPVTGKLALDGMLVRLTDLLVPLYGGKVTGKVDASAMGIIMDLKAAGAGLGKWLEPAMTERGLGAPLPALTADIADFQFRSGAAHKADPKASLVAAKGTHLKAGGLAVTGDLAFRMKDEKYPFEPGSKLAGTFAGADLVSAIAAPLKLTGDLGVTMNLAGEMLAPAISGKLTSKDMGVKYGPSMNVKVSKVDGAFTYEEGQFHVPNLLLGVFGGQLTADLTTNLKAQPPTSSFSVKGGDVQVKTMVEELTGVTAFEKGTLGFAMKMTSAGMTAAGLTGEGSASVDQLTPVASEQLKALSQQLKIDELAKPTLKAAAKSVRVKDGRLHLGAFEGKSSGVGPVGGAWSVGFDQSLAGTLTWNMSLDSTGVPELKGKQLPVDITLGGTIAAPMATTGDVGKAMQKMVADEAKARVQAKADAEKAKLEAKANEKTDALLDKANDKLGGALDALGGKSGAKNLLKGLFR